MYEAFDCNHGVFTGSIINSEATTAAAGSVGKLRVDPFAMPPFCGYNMADYFAHWINIGKNRDHSKLPKIFRCNWFRKDGKFIWPGFGENIRVIKWIFERVDGKNNYVDSPFGRLLAPDTIHISNLSIDKQKFQKLFEFNKEEGLKEVEQIREFYEQFGDRLPKN